MYTLLYPTNLLILFDIQNILFHLTNLTCVIF